MSDETIPAVDGLLSDGDKAAILDDLVAALADEWVSSDGTWFQIDGNFHLTPEHAEQLRRLFTEAGKTIVD